ncbi:sce7726 family protein [Kosakonia radicincitans]|uniref:sce7726 family protein n=1 Tax=Kosakonia radicincitans TaxID=283686 RepID=UPI0005C2E171|nr:sce7726 family protein [Kosakonia radicincitans]KIS45568.1 hypothetical protein LG58_4056 [Kosakonia radicincitans YD4]
MKEIDLKIKLIDFLIKNKTSELSLGAEVRFNFGSRRADIVTLNNDIATVYEIKSAGDSIERLPVQLKNYNDYFDFCYVVCVKENIQAVKSVVNKNIGILLVDDNCVLELRKSKRYKKHSKLSLASTLTIKQLKSKLSKFNFNGKSKFELCELVAKYYKLEEIRSFARYSLQQMISDRYSIFISELGQAISPDDLLTISRMASGVLSKRSKFNSTGHKVIHPYSDPE